MGVGASFCLSETAWRIRILQAWLHGLLERTTTLGHGHGRMTEIVFNTYSITEAGKDFLASEPLPSVALPLTRPKQLGPTPIESEECSAGVKLTRKSKGTHLLPVLLALLSSSEKLRNLMTTNTLESFAWIILNA